MLAQKPKGNLPCINEAKTHCPNIFLTRIAPLIEEVFATFFGEPETIEAAIVQQSNSSGYGPFLPKGEGNLFSVNPTSIGLNYPR